ncbi:hypothetical protein B0H21DRAFT_827034 [Amylocystis lapponica]|nr:hypothetical protein B0H21DRAFT_827034 [Amylocystis lapponica]
MLKVESDSRRVSVEKNEIETVEHVSPKGNIGNAKLQGLTTQLDLTGNKYNIALTMYFIPYCLCECPAKYISKFDSG